MKIKYFGTAAYEGVPSLYCQCETCKKSRAAGGRSLRSRSQALINDDLLVDFPADTVWHAQRYGLDLSAVNHCLITHSHSDHLYPEDIEIARRDYCQGYTNTLHFHAWEDGYRKIKAVTDSELMRSAADVALITPFHAFTVGGYRILPLEANHDPASSPVFYRVEGDGKSLLYGNDTGYFSEKVWAELKKAGRLDLVSLDCTGGVRTGWRDGHMCLETDLEVFRRMEKEGITDERTIKVINHFSHNGGATYDELAAEAAKYGAVVSFDGLEIEF